MSADRWLVFGAFALFVLSLFLPAIDGPGFPAMSGMDVLRQGTSGWRYNVVAWYANPVLLAALIAILLGRCKIALAASLVAIVLALSSFAAGPLAESAGQSVPAFSFAIGFYLWLLAFPAAVVAAGLGIYKESKGGSRG